MTATSAGFPTTEAFGLAAAPTRPGPTPAEEADDFDVVSVSRTGCSFRDVEPLLRGGPVVLDLGHGTLTCGRSRLILLVRLCAQKSSSVAVVCGSRTRRSLLRRWGVEAVAPVFTTVGDAVQSLVLVALGYGDGWATEAGAAHSRETSEPSPHWSSSSAWTKPADRRSG